MKDPIVEEVRKSRQDHAREFNYDLKEICDDLKKIEKKCKKRLLSLPPKLLKRYRRNKTDEKGSEWILG